jgi:hypothetical protein
MKKKSSKMKLNINLKIIVKNKLKSEQQSANIIQKSTKIKISKNL